MKVRRWLGWLFLGVVVAGIVEAARRAKYLVKPGAKLGELVAEMRHGLDRAAEVYRRRGFVLWVTSGNDGKHGAGSLHYANRAADLRVWGIPEAQRRAVAAELAAALGPGFDVVYESDLFDAQGKQTRAAHIHMEWDPKPGEKPGRLA